MLLGAMRLMHSPDQENPKHHQEALARLLDEAVSLEASYAEAIRGVLGEFSSGNPQQYAGSPLAAVGSRIGL